MSITNVHSGTKKHYMLAEKGKKCKNTNTALYNISL
jgi:hypothetical protein